MHPGGARAARRSGPGLLDARSPVELWGARGARLEEEVARAATPEQQATVLLRWLIGQTRGARAPDPVVAALRSRLSAAAAPIASFAREIGYGERQLRRRVVAEVGYGPKHLARVLRLRRTLAVARGDAPEPDGARLRRRLRRPGALLPRVQRAGRRRRRALLAR